MEPERTPPSRKRLKVSTKMDDLNSKIGALTRIHYQLQLELERLQKDVAALENTNESMASQRQSAERDIISKEEKVRALKAEIKNLQGKQEKIGTDGSRMNNTRLACEERARRLDSEYRTVVANHLGEIEAAQKHAPSLLNLSNEADFAQLASFVYQTLG